MGQRGVCSPLSADVSRLLLPCITVEHDGWWEPFVHKETFSLNHEALDEHASTVLRAPLTACFARSDTECFPAIALLLQRIGSSLCQQGFATRRVRSGAKAMYSDVQTAFIVEHLHYVRAMKFPLDAADSVHSHCTMWWRVWSEVDETDMCM